tara:strand:- start:4890 stop:5354 length:465 start_codon:yes stop_codon:yes gene_type:complete
MNGTKHIVECHCILPQYRDRKDPVYHKFVVFSELDASDTVLPNHAQCNNCGTVHKVYDICKSEIIVGKEESVTVEKIKDVAISLPGQIVELLESYSLDLCDYQMARFILENKKWEYVLTLDTEIEGEKTTGKILRFLGPDRFRVESFSRQEVIS